MDRPAVVHDGFESNIAEFDDGVLGELDRLRRAQCIDAKGCAVARDHQNSFGIAFEVEVR
jgi:hypothetical protein